MKIITSRCTYDNHAIRPQRLFLFLAVVGVAFLLAPYRDVKGQTPTLEGETFQNSTEPPTKINCDVNSGSIGFELTGIAVGPYKGKFYEAGTLTFDPRTGQITGGQIDFVVSTETDKTVIGRKTPLEGIVQCTVDPKVGISVFSVTVPSLVYTADLLAEKITDQGHATLSFSGSIDSLTKPPTIRIQFTEIFHSSFVSTPGKVTGGGNIVQTDRSTGITFGFNAQNTDNGMKGSGTVIDHNAGVKVKILEIETFGISGTHATFTGRAEVNGVEEKFRIDVDDLGEPGGGIDSFKIVTDSYAGGGTLSGGNIQIHK